MLPESASPSPRPVDVLDDAGPPPCKLYECMLGLLSVAGGDVDVVVADLGPRRLIVLGSRRDDDTSLDSTSRCTLGYDILDLLPDDNGGGTG